MTAVEHITARHAKCLSEYLKAGQKHESSLHLHGQLMGLEFAASCLDNDLGDGLAKSRHLIDQMLVADLTAYAADMAEADEAARAQRNDAAFGHGWDHDDDSDDLTDENTDYGDEDTGEDCNVELATCAAEFDRDVMEGR